MANELHWDIRVLGHEETLFHFQYAKDHPEAATAQRWVGFIDGPQYRIEAPKPIPSLILHVHDVHPHQAAANPDFILFNDDHAEEVFDFAIDNNLGNEFHRTLVQCAAGVSRSSATAIALLVFGGFSYEAAFARIEAVRPWMHPNIWMMEVFDRVLSRDGKLLEFYKEWYRRKLADGAFDHVPADKRYKV